MTKTRKNFNFSIFIFDNLHSKKIKLIIYLFIYKSHDILILTGYLNLNTYFLMKIIYLLKIIDVK